MDKCNTLASEGKDTKKRNRKHKRRPSYLLRVWLKLMIKYLVLMHSFRTMLGDKGNISG